MAARRVLCMFVLVAVAVSLAGCPANQMPPATYKLYVTVTAPFPGYDFTQLVVSPVSIPNSTDLTGALHLIEGNVLVVSGLARGETYDLSLLVHVPGSITWNVTGQTGVVSGDQHWVIYEGGSGGLQDHVIAHPPSRTLQS
jgi:hypothetical protein